MLFGPEVRRTAAHAFNNVGNLTYISAQLNGLDALSDHFADLAGEREDDSKNLVAHLLSSAEGDDALGHYEWLRKSFETSGSGESDPRLEAERLKRFTELTAARRRLIRSGFEQWLCDLDVETLSRLKVGSFDELEQLAKTTLRIEPRPPLFPIDKHAAHVLRHLGLSDQSEDRLLVLIREARRTVVGSSELRVQITKKKHVWVDVGVEGVTLGVRHLSGPLRAGVFQAVGLLDAHGRKHHLDPVPDFRQLIDYCTSHEQEFAGVVRTKKIDVSGGVPPTIPELNYPSAVATRVAQMGGSSKEKPREGADLSLRFWRKKEAGGDQQVLRVDLYKGGKTLGLRFGEGLGLRVTEQFPGLPVRTSKQRTICKLRTEEEMVAVLDWVVGQLPKT